MIFIVNLIDFCGDCTKVNWCTIMHIFTFEIVLLPHRYFLCLMTCGTDRVFVCFFTQIEELMELRKSGVEMRLVQLLKESISKTGPFKCTTLKLWPKIISDFVRSHTCSHESGLSFMHVASGLVSLCLHQWLWWINCDTMSQRRKTTVDESSIITDDWHQEVSHQISNTGHCFMLQRHWRLLPSWQTIHDMTWRWHADKTCVLCRWHTCLPFLPPPSLCWLLCGLSHVRIT